MSKEVVEAGLNPYSNGSYFLTRRILELTVG